MVAPLVMNFGPARNVSAIFSEVGLGMTGHIRLRYGKRCNEETQQNYSGDRFESEGRNHFSSPISSRLLSAIRRDGEVA